MSLRRNFSATLGKIPALIFRNWLCGLSCRSIVEQWTLFASHKKKDKIKEKPLVYAHSLLKFGYRRILLLDLSLSWVTEKLDRRFCSCIGMDRQFLFIVFSFHQLSLLLFSLCRDFWCRAWISPLSSRPVHEHLPQGFPCRGIFTALYTYTHWGKSLFVLSYYLLPAT